MILASAPLAGGAPAGGAATADDGLEHFERRVRPILVERCYACHAADARRVRGGLLVDTRAGLLRGGDSGPALVPGDPDASLLVRAVRYDDLDLQMPPKGKLPADEIAALEAWVRAGAPDPRTAEPAKGESASSAETPAESSAASDEALLAAGREHWAYQPMAVPAPPAVRAEDWCRDPLDAFVLARLEDAGLAPAPPADRRTWLRRVTFDLTGLPPAPAEVADFLADERADAFERVVDRLLASPHYGERQARRWLDLARYADSNGLDENLALGHAWRYRDWVVRALNADMPYDEFVTWQIAGDLLPEPRDADGRIDERALHDRWVATGFLVLGPKMLAEQDKEKLVMDVVDEQIDVLSKAVLGTTVACARCHDHKFDPVPTSDYYALAGILRSTSTMASLDHVSRWRERELATAAQKARRVAWEVSTAETRAGIDALVAEAERGLQPVWRGDLARYLLAGTAAARAALLVQAEDFSRGNLRVDRAQWGSPEVAVVHTHEAGPQHVEYDLTVPAGGRWELTVRYAAQESRPMRLLVNGAVVKERALAEATGGWLPDAQAWHPVGVLALRPGRNVLRLERAGPVPHLDELILAPVAPGADASHWPTDVAGAAGLVPQVVRNWARFLESAERADDPFLAPWFAFASLAVELDGAGLAGELETFAAAAERVTLELSARRDAGELALSPLAAGVLEGLPPTSLREVAARYQAICAAVDASSPPPAPPAAPPTDGAEPDPAALARASVHRLLHGAHGPFAVPRALAESLYPPETLARLERARADLSALEAAEPEPVPRALAVLEGEPADLAVHRRGSHLNLAAEPTPRGVLRVTEPAVGPPEIPAESSGRLELARWLCDPEHPLTARVAANRAWQAFFGEGLVATPSNFGRRGAAPTHPALLDRLARDLVAGGWSLKALHRRIALSATYRQSSAYDERAAAVDPETELLWRMPRRRLDAEAIRDALLAVAGTLDRTVGGSLLDTPNGGYVTNDQSANQARYASPRRSLYLPLVRNAMYDFFAAFDFNDPSVSVAARPSTTVASQALFLLNSPLALDASRALAERVLAASAPEGASGPGPAPAGASAGASDGESDGASPASTPAELRDDERHADAGESPSRATDVERIARLWELAYARPPRPEETARARAWLARARELTRPAEIEAPPAEPVTAAGERRAMGADAPAFVDPELAAWSGLCQVVLSSNEFLYVE